MAWGLPLRNLIDRVDMNDRPTCPGVSVVSAASPVGSLSQLLRSMTHFVAGRWVGQLQGWMVPHSSKAPSKWFACGKLTDASWCRPEQERLRNAGEQPEQETQWGTLSPFWRSELPGLLGNGDVKKVIVTHWALAVVDMCQMWGQQRPSLTCGDQKYILFYFFLNIS